MMRQTKECQLLQILVVIGNVAYLTLSLLFLIPALLYIFDHNSPSITSQNKLFLITTSILLSTIWGRQELKESNFNFSKKLLSRMLLGFTFGLCTVLAAYQFGKNFVDLSWDGRAYHQIAINELANGWNPIHDKPLNQELNYNYKWVNEYPKSWWISLAHLKIIDDLEPLKGIYIVLSAATLSGSTSFLIGAGLTPLSSFLLATAVILNPVLVGQATTFYLDGIIYLYQVQLALVALQYVKTKRSSLLILLTILGAYLANLKFTGIVYSSLIIFTLISYLLIFEKKFLKTYKLVTLAIISAITPLIAGVNPYISNIGNGRHIFHPVMGKNAIDFISGNVPFSHLGTSSFNPIHKFLIANVPYHQEQSLTTRMVRQLFQQGSSFSHYTDARTLGFGELFAPSLGLCILYFIYTLFSNFRLWKIYQLKVYFVAGFSCVLLFINPEFWWARYSPQWWLLLVIPVVFTSKLINLNLTNSRFGIFLSIIIMLNVYTSTTRTVKQILNDNPSFRESRNWIVSEVINRSTGTQQIYFETKQFTDIFLQLQSKRINIKQQHSGFCEKRTKIFNDDGPSGFTICR